MAEWFKATVLKTAEARASVGSNPTPSARTKPVDCQSAGFIFQSVIARCTNNGLPALYNELRAYMPRLHILIHGSVQGVFFRASIVDRARPLGLMGWVRNRFDGAVEVVAEGSAASLESLRAFCEHGPPGAVVRKLDVRDESESGSFIGFSIRPEG